MEEESKTGTEMVSSEEGGEDTKGECKNRKMRGRVHLIRVQLMGGVRHCEWSKNNRDRR